MIARLLTKTRSGSWQGCRPLTPAERMAQYSARRAAEIQARENAGAAAPKLRMVNGRPVLVGLS